MDWEANAVLLLALLSLTFSGEENSPDVQTTKTDRFISACSIRCFGKRGFFGLRSHRFSAIRNRRKHHLRERFHLATQIASAFSPDPASFGNVYGQGVHGSRSLAREAAHVIAAEINSTHQAQARQNLTTAGLLDRVTFLLVDIMDDRTWDGLPRVEAALLDPDWAVTGPDHVHRFVRSTTRPPADALLERTLRATDNVALVLLPRLDVHDLDALPGHEPPKALFGPRVTNSTCLYFGDLAVSLGETGIAPVRKPFRAALSHVHRNSTD